MRGWRYATLKFIEEQLENHKDELNRGLYGPSFLKADFTGCNLDGFDFGGKDLRFATFAGASLVGANFRGAILHGADFNNADLTGADFRCAIITEANFTDAETDNTMLKHTPLACPSHGEFIGWKRAKYRGEVDIRSCIVKLKIPSDALRVSGTTKQCRCNKAIVLAAYDQITGEELDPADTILFSLYDNSFVYKVGELIRPRRWCDPNRFNECSSGIHFFVDRKAAERY